MTGRTRTLLIVLGVAVVAAVAFWKLRPRGETGDAGTTAGSPAGGSATGSTGTATGPGAGRPRIDPRSGATLPGSAGPDEIDDGDGDPDTRTYVMDNGAVVRDHRGPGFGPPINPPAMRPDQRTMNTEITAKIYQQLAPMVAACGAAVPAGDRGKDPYTYVTLTVKVAAGKLTTTDVYPTVNDITGASATSFPSCLAEKARTIALATGDEPDHDDYIVQYPIRLR